MAFCITLRTFDIVLQAIKTCQVFRLSVSATVFLIWILRQLFFAHFILSATWTVQPVIVAFLDLTGLSNEKIALMLDDSSIPIPKTVLSRKFLVVLFLVEKVPKTILFVF